MIADATKKPVLSRAFLIYLAMFSVVVGVVISLASGLGLASDPTSGRYTAGFPLGLLMCVGGVFGLFKFAQPNEWQPKVMEPASRPWRLRTPRNAAITLGLSFLLASALPAGIFAIAWTGRTHWERIDIPTDNPSSYNPTFINGKWCYSFNVGGSPYLCFDEIGAPKPAHSQSIWYNPLNGFDNHVGGKPPAFNPILFTLFLVSLFTFWAFFAVKLLRTLRQMRANSALDLAHRAT